MILSGQFECLEERTSFTLCVSGFSVEGVRSTRFYMTKKINNDYSGIEQ